MRSPLGEPIRSESVAGMDMLNDMFQRQVGARALARSPPGIRCGHPDLLKGAMKVAAGVRWWEGGLSGIVG